MRSLLLCTIARFTLPLLMMVSIFLLFRGHDAPGGGFIAGLMAASAFSVYTLAFGIEQVIEVLHIQPRTLLGVGILIATSAGLIGPLNGSSFLTGKWIELEMPFFGFVHFGTPILFDIGVYLVVFGMVTSIVIGLAEE